MRLRDIAWTEKHARNLSVGEDAAIAEIIHAQGPLLARAEEQAANQGMIGAGFQRTAGNAFAINQPGQQVLPSQQSFDFSFHPGIGFAG
jgi:hypothetical protein